MSSALRLGLGVQRVAVRGFHTSRARMSGHGPHYPEGPLHNIPWTPKGKWNVRFKLFGFYGMSLWMMLIVGVGFSLPFVAGWWQL
jgi:hypothetical protein